MNTKNIQAEWKIEVNDRYHKVVDVIITLSTASLVLPILFFREFLGIKPEDALVKYIDWKILSSWVLLLSAIVFGGSFFYFSAKWVKQAYGQKTTLSEKSLEGVLDILFWLMIGCFVLGIIIFLWFSVVFKVGS